jgi:hypothetical protein
MGIDGYSIGGYRCLLMVIRLVPILLNGYWWLFHFKSLVVINGYYISGCW